MKTTMTEGNATKKPWAVGLLACAVLAGGCGPKVKVKPAGYEVESIAVVGTAMNRDIYNLKSPSNGVGLNLLTGLLADADAEEMEQVAAHGLVAYSVALESAGPWEVRDPSWVVEQEAYRGASEAEKAAAALNTDSKAVKTVLSITEKVARGNWITPPGVHPVPVREVAEPMLGNNASTAERRRELGALATELGVDAVAVLELDLAFKPSGLVSVGFGSTSYARAKPSVAGSLLVIDRDGEVAVKMPVPTRGGGAREKYKATWMVKNGELDLRHKNGKAVDRYNGAIDRAAASFEQKLAKKYAKGLEEQGGASASVAVASD